MQPSGETEERSVTINLVNNYKDDLLLSQTIRDSLDLIGWPLPWETWHDSTGLFHFALEHPGKRYVIDYRFDDKTARVQEKNKGFWRAFNSMHGVGAVPNSTFMNVWKWYSHVVVILVTFSVFIGIYLWYKGRRDKKAGWYTLVIGFIVTLLWMFQLYHFG